jgi:GH18 family chitinase
MRVSAAIASSLLAAAWAAAAGAGTRPPEPRPAPPPTAARSIHQLELQRHRQQPPPPRRLPDPAELARARTRALSRVVYGYYPYWVHDLTTIRWELLTHLAWFAVEIDGRGDAVALHGWPDHDTVATAQAAGVRVDLTFTLFDGAAIRALVTDADRRANAIDTMIDQLAAGGADGIAIDFEGLIDGSREGFTLFVHELRQALDARGHPQAEISIAGPAVDWSGQFDLDALLDAADWYFIMGYGYFWSGSARAGPTGMLRTPAAWQHIQTRSMLRSLAEYSLQIPAAKRRQILHGVPYYGRWWRTESEALGAVALGDEGPVTYSAARQDLDAGRQRRWAPGVANPWYAWQDAGGWNQIWYDDAESLAAKYALLLEQELGGVGIWALNYDAPHAELWDLLAVTFEQEPDPVAGDRHDPLLIDAFPFSDERDTRDGPARYFNFYGCRPDLPEYGREWVYQVHVCQPGRLTASVPEYADRDPDLHLLDAPLQSACLARAHLDLEAELQPGAYWLVVDTFVADAVELAGAYSLEVDFAPAPGSQPCPGHLVCRAGECVCAGAGLSDCAGACVDLQTDDAHCGSCGHACPPGQHCEAGACVADAAPDGGSGDGRTDAGDGGDDGDGADGGREAGADEAAGGGGCGCATSSKAPLCWLGGLLLLLRRRLRRRPPRCDG